MDDSEIVRVLHRIADAVQIMSQLSQKPNCNDCGKKKECEYVPKWGDPVRINCPLWEEES